MRVFWRSFLLLLFTVGSMLVALVFTLLGGLGRRNPPRTFTCHLWCKALAWCMGLRIEVRGQPLAGAGMVLSNHISWLDIPVLGAQAPLVFLSKSEVRQWPVVGWLAEQGGTLFIERGTGQSGHVIQQLSEKMHEGWATLVFAEGTTTDGRDVRKFHRRLLRSVQHSPLPVQPVCLCYIEEDAQGQPVPSVIAPYIDDQDLFSHLLVVLKSPRLRVQVTWLDPLDATASDASILAAKAEGQVREVLRGTFEAVNSPVPTCG